MSLDLFYVVIWVGGDPEKVCAVFRPAINSFLYLVYLSNLLSYRNARNPREERRVRPMQARMTRQGWTATCRPHQVKNLSNLPVPGEIRCQCVRCGVPGEIRWHWLTCQWGTCSRPPCFASCFLFWFWIWSWFHFSSSAALIVSCQEVEIFGNVQADSLYGFTIKDLKIPTYYLFMQRL